MLENHVVHFPEGALFGCGFGALGGVFGVRMNLRQRKMAIDETEAAPEKPLRFLNDGIRGTAVRAYEITVLDELQRGVRVTFAVISVGDRWFESHARLSFLPCFPGRRECRRHRGSPRS